MSETPEVEINDDVANLVNREAAPEPVQVKESTVIFVPQQDFEGRINEQPYDFIKGVPVKMTQEQANVWLEAKKGYVK